MKVKELISLLGGLHPELEVLVQGYESGYSPIEEITEIMEFGQNPYVGWWNGRFQHLEYIKNPEGQKTFKAVVLKREDR